MICGSSLIHKLALVIGVPGNGIREAKNHRKHQENYDLKGGCFHEIESCFEKKETQANSEGQMQGEEVLENVEASVGIEKPESVRHPTSSVVCIVPSF